MEAGRPVSRSLQLSRERVRTGPGKRKWRLRRREGSERAGSRTDRAFFVERLIKKNQEEGRARVILASSYGGEVEIVLINKVVE